MILSRISGSLWSWLLSLMHSLSTAPPHTAQWALFRACLGTSSQGASENELMCPQEKQTWYLPLFGLYIGLEKKWDFYVRNPSSRTPSVARQTPRQQTINRQEAQSLAHAHVWQSLSLHRPSCFFQSLPHYINTQRLFNTLSDNWNIILTQQAWFSYP